MKNFSKIFLGIVVLVVLILMFRSGNERVQVRATILRDIENASVDPVKPGDLNRILNSEGPSDDSGKQQIEQFKGKVIQWALKVYEVIEKPEYYRIHVYPEEKMSGMVIFVYPRSSQEEHYLKMLKEGEPIKIKGMIQKISNKNLQINPAILLPKK